MKIARAAIYLGLAWAGLSGCNEEVQRAACSVEQSAAGVTITCSDGTSATIPRAGSGDGGASNSCTVSRGATGATIECADGSRVTLPYTPGVDAGAPSCDVTEADDGSISISCADGSHASLPGDVRYLQLVGATTAACGACHDSTEARAHIAIMTVEARDLASAGNGLDSGAGPVETCATCHGEDGIAPVSRVHVRPELGAPGLKTELTAANIDPSTRKATVRVQLSDSAGALLAREGITMSFVISKVETVTPASGGAPIAGPYRNYLARAATQQDTPAYPLDGGAPRVVQQPTGENANTGVFTQVSTGVYDYTFAYQLPADYDATATHVVGLYATRTVSGVRFAANAERFFVPADASAATLMRDAVHTETCNGCHNPLSGHGGARKDVQLCLNCHSQGAVDAESGNVIDFKVMVHKIHMGERLPSVQAGTPYRIIGNAASVHDWSEVLFPRPIENCQTCHTATDSDRWVTNGTNDVCTACHENIAKPAAEGGHPIALPMNGTCGSADCHGPSGEGRDARAAHATPLNTASAPLFELEIVSVTVPNVESAPRVRIRARTGTRGTGAMTPVASVSSFAVLEVFLNGPNKGFAWNGQDLVRVPKEQLVELAATEVLGEFTFALPKSLRELVGGAGDPNVDSYTLSLRGQYDPTPGAAPDNDRVEQRRNPAAAFTASKQLVARTALVETDRCDRCHGALSAHGGANTARSVEQCAMCHTSTLDTRVRQGANGQAGPTTSLRLSTLVHRIHGDVIADAPFSVFGFRAEGAPYPVLDLSKVAFPGDVRDCSTCHATGGNFLPLAGSAPPTRTVLLGSDGGVLTP